MSLKYSIEMRDNAANITISPVVDPYVQYEREKMNMQNEIARMQDRAAQKSPHITEEANGSDAKSVAVVSNNDEAVTQMDYQDRFKRLVAGEHRFIEQMERAKELLGARGLNKRAMHYILTGEKTPRASKARSKR